MRVLTDDNIPFGAWSAFIDRNVHATPFQLPSYFRFFNLSDNFRARSYAVDDCGTLKALAVVTYQREKGLAGFFSARQIIYGGPLADDDCPAALDLLLRAIDADAPRGAIYNEIRNLTDYGRLRDVFEGNGYVYVPYLNFRVDTSNYELMASRLSSSRQRQIRKARRLSVTCTGAVDADEVRQFYVLLKDLYNNKLHKPLPSENFFLRFFEMDLGRFLLVHHEGRIIGGIMCPVLPGRALYEFYICGRDDAGEGLYPGVMATWAAMEYAAHNDIPVFDFMGAGKPDEQYGVRDFKARFGGEQVEYGRFMKIRKQLMYRIGSETLRLMKRKTK